MYVCGCVYVNWCLWRPETRNGSGLELQAQAHVCSGNQGPALCNNNIYSQSPPSPCWAVGATRPVLLLSWGCDCPYMMGYNLELREKQALCPPSDFACISYLSNQKNSRDIGQTHYCSHSPMQYIESPHEWWAVTGPNSVHDDVPMTYYNQPRWER